MIKGIGCDIVSIKRIETIVNKTPTFLTRVYSKAEIEQYHIRNDSIYYLATRFAAKEATIKALSDKDIDLNSIEILNDEFGKPFIKVNGTVNPNIYVSISYEDEFAIAYVIVS